MRRPYWRMETGIFLVLWLVLMVGGRSRFFRDPGTFWHTVVGERLLTTREFPDTDQFSFTFAGAPWIPHQWLGEITMAAIHRLDGFDSLLLAAVTLLAALFTWLAIRLMRAGLHASISVALMTLAVAASASHFHVRPHLGTMLFLALTVAFLCDFDAGRCGLRRLPWLVPLFALWTNVHGGIIGGLGTLGLAAAYWSLSWGLNRPSPIRRGRQVLVLGGVVVACGLTAFLNPYGARLPQAWLGIVDSPLLPEIIMEHAPLHPGRADGWLVLLFGAIYGIALAGLRPCWPRFTWLLPLVWLVLAWSHIRHAPLFALTALLALAELIPHTRWTGWLACPGRDLFQTPSPVLAIKGRRWHWRAGLIPAGVVGLTLVLQTAAVPLPVLGHGWARLDPNYWPVEILPDLKEQARLQPPGAPVFNELLYGGFLIYHAPRLRVFVDDRCELYGDRWLEEFVDAEWQDTGERLHVLERQRGPFLLALTRRDSGYDHYFRGNSEWECVRGTMTANLYRRRVTASPPAQAPLRLVRR